MIINDFNLTEDAERGAELNLLNPRTSEKFEGTVIKLAGADSRAYRAKKQQQESARLAKMVKRQDYSLQATPEEESELLAEITLGWTGVFEKINGEVVEIEFSKEAARKLYLDQFWIRAQVSGFVTERSNFFTMP